jgi:GGDEF domain-containing protein
MLMNSPQTPDQTLQLRLQELELRNRLLEAEVERLQIYKEHAYTDALTEIPNRRFYFERIDAGGIPIAA